MTTTEYDRTLEKFKALQEQGQSVGDYLAQLPLFAPELNEEQRALLASLDNRPQRRQRITQQLGLF